MCVTRSAPLKNMADYVEIMNYDGVLISSRNFPLAVGYKK